MQTLTATYAYCNGIDFKPQSLCTGQTQLRYRAKYPTARYEHCEHRTKKT
jgi:hypothetical protein